MDTIKINKKNTKMIAHRGLSGLEKENTVLAFVAAGNKSYYGIECDIHKTKDGVFVVIHDDHTGRVSIINKIISESTYEELLNINLNDVIDNAPKAYLKIPTLAEYLDTCHKYRKHCVIEFKGKFSDDDLTRVINLVDSRGYLNQTTFISFELDNLLRLRNMNQDLSLQFLTSSYTSDLLQILKKYHLDLDIYFEPVTKAILKELHDSNILVNVWTVNDPVIGEKLVNWGVDFITTNILE